MASGIVLFHFDEKVGLQPADALGNLDDLTIETGLTMPAVVEGAFTGRGRRFLNGVTGLVARDRGLGTLLQRDATVQVILALTALGGTHTHTIYARGTNDGTLADRCSLGLQVIMIGTTCEVRLFHHDNNGTFHALPPGVFTHPGNGKLFLLTATRTWIRNDSLGGEVVVRYFIGEQMIAEISTPNAGIAGGTTARSSVGVRGNAGAWTDYLDGTIDELLVLDYPLTPGEVRQTWRRLTQHQPAGVDMFVGLMPPGAPWYDNPGNEIGKRAKAVGESLGTVIAAAEELKELWLPGEAPLAVIGRHEALCDIVAGPRDTIEQRNARVIAHRQEPTDFALASILAVVADPFGSTVDQLQLLEVTNTVEEYFDSAAGVALDPTRWQVDGAGAAVLGANKLTLTTPNAYDSRYENARLGGEYVRMPIDSGVTGLNSALAGRVYAQAQLLDYTGLAQGTGVGLFVASLSRSSHIWFGVYKHTVAEGAPNTYDLYFRVYDQGGVFNIEGSLPFAPAATFGAGVQVWLRIVPRLGNPGFISLGQAAYSLWASVDGPNSGFVEVTHFVMTIPPMDWVGFSIISTIAAPAAATAVIRWVSIHTPDGTRPFHFYVLRDAAEWGSVSPAKAQAKIQQVKPGHVYGASCQSAHVVYDDPLLGGFDRGPR